MDSVNDDTSSSIGELLAAFDIPEVVLPSPTCDVTSGASSPSEEVAMETKGDDEMDDEPTLESEDTAVAGDPQENEEEITNASGITKADDKIGVQLSRDEKSPTSLDVEEQVGDTDVNGRSSTPVVPEGGISSEVLSTSNASTLDVTGSIQTSSVSNFNLPEPSPPVPEKVVIHVSGYQTKSVANVGMTQTVASDASTGGKSMFKMDNPLVSALTAPVMSPAEGTTSPARQTVAKRNGTITGATTTDPRNGPPSLKSVDEFNAYFDRQRELRELDEKKRDLLGSKNPIPTYKCPKLTEEQISALNMTKDVFPCLECGDTFLFSASLDMHMERKTLLICFLCVWCTVKRKLIFYNKCSFLAHLRKHKNLKESDVDIIKKEALIAPINSSESYKMFTKLTVPSNVDVGPKVANESSEVGVTAKRTTAATVALPSSTAVTVATGKPVVSSIPAVVQSSRVGGNTTKQVLGSAAGTKAVPIVATALDRLQCQACRVWFDPAIYLSKHLKRISSTMVHCNQCKMTLTNSCQLAIHEILHENSESFFSCPECGVNLPSLEAVFRHQNAQNCLHWSRRPLFKCSICQKFATSLHSYKKHLESVHQELFYKCSLCQLAFRNKQTAVTHSLQVHKVKHAGYGILYKCPLCKSVYSTRNTLDNHLDTHSKEGAPVIKIEKFVYVCPTCSKPFDEAFAMRTHIREIHGGVDRLILNCDLCLKSFSHIGLLMHHRKMCLLGQAVSLSNPVTVKRPLADQTTNTVKKVQDTSSKETVKIFICGVCGQRFPDDGSNNLQTHMLQMHAKQLQKVGVKSQSNPTEAPTSNSGKPFLSLATKSPQPTTAQVPKKPQEPIKVERFTSLVCASCQHKSSDRLEFEKHIAGHKTQRHHSQCHQCGLCFTVADSLRKHMFIKHKIKDVAQFDKLRQEVISQAEEEVKEQEKQTEKCAESPEKNPAINQEGKYECSVCFAEFDSVKTLTVHKRSHGMAFLSLKKSTDS